MIYNKNKVIALLGLLLLPAVVYGAPLPDFTFKSPAFNGQGYSSHVLTIENQEASRRKAVEDKIQSAIDKAATDAKNTNLQKFLNNLESRIYAQISQNLATAMFANGGSNSGTLNFEGNTIFWTKDGTSVYLTVTDTVGNNTSITIPLGQFQF
jgi:membrane-bound inhibitor of C-type lysozyme